jgi:chemotaxis protein MotB
MARKKKHPEHVNHERWLVSYADFITLLFAFFVVMFASSQTDKGKQQQVSDSVKRALDDSQIAAAISGILGGAADDKGKGNAQMRGPGGAQKQVVTPKDKEVELTPAIQHLTKALEHEIASGKIKVEMTPRGLVVSMRQAAFFPSGDDTIAPSATASIRKIADTIHDLPNQIRLEGHTDSQPVRRGRFKSNWELSAARAISMMELLTTEFGIAKDRVAIGGYADTVPAAPNETEKGRALNRRVDIVILNMQGLMREPESKPSPSPPHAPKKGH